MVQAEWTFRQLRQNRSRIVERVLVVRLDAIGDVVLTTPFLRELRRNLPKARITLLVRPAIHNLVELCPYVNEVLTYEPPVSRYWRPFQATSRALRLARKQLWSRDFDLAIAPRWDVDSYHGSMVTFLSGARQRLGYSEKVTAEKSRLNGGLDRLFTHVIDGGVLKHEVRKNLDLIAFMGGTVEQDRLELWFDEGGELFVNRILEEHGIHDGDLLIAIAPGARDPKRMWPLSNFVELGIWVEQHCGGSLMIVGSQEEEQLGNMLRVRLQGKVIDAVGLSLREAGALLKRCDLFVGNDAGPMHMAAAVGLPVIEISCHPLGGSTGHSNSPERFGPWRAPQIVLRPAKARDPCSDACVSHAAHCIEGVSVEQVKEAMTTLLAQRRNRLANPTAVPLSST
ncbi:MAG: glycosyltransferase family 9 protein [Betaproteobacteria bacterium]|nr:glycosyltransferase family 9 protein [Betaproteobacteria bacterium]